MTVASLQAWLQAWLPYLTYHPKVVGDTALLLIDDVQKSNKLLHRLMLYTDKREISDVSRSFQKMLNVGDFFKFTKLVTNIEVMFPIIVSKQLFPIFIISVCLRKFGSVKIVLN